MVKALQSTPDYRPHIDGLRALAVLAVILNHIDHRWVPSGYLGVDIFFVISGFVITLSLSHHAATDLRSFLVGFYARRFRRIIPALIVCLGVTGLAAWLLDPEPEISLKTGLAALIGVSNLYLLSISADYFAQTSALNFLTHTWSLGVEEQFYLFFPLLMWWSSRKSVGEPTQAAIRWLVVISLISIVLLFIIPGARGGAAYFLPFGRLWELAAGALMALVPRFMPRIVVFAGRGAIQALALLGLLVVLALPLTPSAVWALAIVPPTMLLLLASQTTWPFRVLSWSPVRWVGRISYSLYLWHWPVITIGLMLFRPTPRLAFVQLAITFILAAITYYGVEQPFRRQGVGAAPNRIFMRMGVAIAALAFVMCGLLVFPNRTPLATNVFGRLPVAFPDWPGSSSRHERDCVLDGKRPLSPSDALSRCTLVPAVPERPTLWVMGDSHAGQLRGLLGELRQKAGFGIHLVETPGIPYPLSPGMNNPLREELFAQTQSRLKKGDVIIVARLLFDREEYLRPVQDLNAWVSAVEALARAMQPLGIQIVVLGPVPMYRYPSIARCAPDRTGRTPCDEPRAPLAQATGNIAQGFEDAHKRAPNLFYFDSFAALCPQDLASCSPIRQRTPLYRDRDHLNAAGSAALAGAFLNFLNAHHLAIGR